MNQETAGLKDYDERHFLIKEEKLYLAGFVEMQSVKILLTICPAESR